jgi:Plant transposon protein
MEENTQKILEAIADDSCFFWFDNFGDPGSCNDTNVLDKSIIVGALINGSLNLKTEPYQLNGTSRDWMYFLVDGIYPNWAVFVKIIPKSKRRTPTESAFARKQEHIRKDVERAFGILVKKFHILVRPICLWDLSERMGTRSWACTHEFRFRH